jgi:hypothetical protein
MHRRSAAVLGGGVIGGDRALFPTRLFAFGAQKRRYFNILLGISDSRADGADRRPAPSR